MGTYLFNQYTYLHFATGIIVYFWGVSFVWWFIIHSIFEWAENTTLGIKTINTLFTIWPGGKPGPDAFINIVGDSIGALLGWLTAFWIDTYGHQHGWYQIHINKMITK